MEPKLIYWKKIRSLYTFLAVRSLNLAGVHAAESCAEIKTFFGNIQALYVFFSCSPARWKVLLEETALSLHKLSDTRWSAHIAAVKPLVKKPREIIAALDRIVNQLDLTVDMLNQAKSLGKYFKSFESAVLLTILYKTLQNIDGVSRCLQSESITIEEEAILIQQLLDDLGRIRSSWNCILTEAKLVAGNLGFDTEFKVKRTRRVKKFHEEPSNTAHYLDNTEKNFEVNIFNVALDHIILQIQSRFLHKMTKLVNLRNSIQMTLKKMILLRKFVTLTG